MPDSDLMTGLVLGLAAATCQSFSYLASRTFNAKYPNSALRLLVLSHLIMAVFSLLLLPFLWPEKMPPDYGYLQALSISSLTYFFGQLFLFIALKKADASRISPLLGLKILLLALITTLFFAKTYSTGQWAAAIISIIAALLLRQSGKKTAISSLIWVLFACVGYCFSDLYIKILVNNFAYLGLLKAAAFCVCLSYIFCGLLSIAALPFLKKLDFKMLKQAIPFSIAWFLAMLLLFACLAKLGVVFANIIQSTRGIISVFLGSLVARAGFLHLEENIERKVFFRRIGAALLMTGAIALFYLS